MTNGQATRIAHSLQYVVLVFAALALALLTAGCGGETGEPLDYDHDHDAHMAEIGQYSLGLTAKTGYGVSNTLTPPNEGAQCKGTSCILPGSKTVAFKCTSTFSGSELTLCETFVDQEVAALRAQFPTWQFGRVTAGVANVNISRGNTGNSPIASDLRAFVTLTHNGCTAILAESPAADGTYRRCDTLTTLVDWAEVESKFSNASERIRVKGHTIGMVAAAAVGVGWTTAVIDRKNSAEITQTQAKQINLRDGDRCRVNAYNPSGDTVTISGGC